MKAILTRYLGPTNFKGSRICARAEGVKAVILPYSHELDSEGNHRAAAEALAAKYGWTGRLIGGGLPDESGYAFVFAPGRTPRTAYAEAGKRIPMLLAERLEVRQGVAYFAGSDVPALKADRECPSVSPVERDAILAEAVARWNQCLECC